MMSADEESHDAAYEWCVQRQETGHFTADRLNVFIGFDGEIETIEGQKCGWSSAADNYQEEVSAF